MGSVLYLTVFLSVMLLTVASTRICYKDLNFTVSAWKVDSDWLTKTSIQYSLSDGTAKIISEFHNSPKEETGDSSAQKQFPVRVDVDHCGGNCAGNPYLKINVVTEKPPPKVVPGYDFFPGVGYYKLHTTGQTWDQAWKICEETGGHLAVINSQEESKVLQQLLAQTQVLNEVLDNNFVFIGFHDRFIEGEYVTISGTSLASTGYTRWYPGEPNNIIGDNEDCGSVHRNGELNDSPCDVRLAFFCEQELDC